MALDIRTTPGPALGYGSSSPPHGTRQWALAEELYAVRVVLWGAITPAETSALDERLLTLRRRSAPLLLDLTGVTALAEESVAWLGLMHEEFGIERPMLVSVVADGAIHRRLTRPDAPQLRLTLE
jgi:hypothetical protein